MKPTLERLSTTRAGQLDIERLSRHPEGLQALFDEAAAVDTRVAA